MGHIETKIKLKFPNGFLWGAATAAHQIEGNNKNSDWWAWEHSLKREIQLKIQGKNPVDYYSGIACDSYNRFGEDFSLAKQLNHNATRLSIEWSRIEPKEGEFDQKELDHYEKVLQTAKSYGLVTFVTLHHFTNPKWFADIGGFVKKDNTHFFVRYAALVIKRLDQYVDFWISINEPEGYAAGSFLAGVWPPQKKNIFTAFKVARNLISSHKQLAKIIKTTTKKPFGMAYDIVDLMPTSHLSRLLAKWFYDRFNKFVFYQTVDFCDFIGVNYYFHHHLGLFGKRSESKSRHKVSDIGWGIHPEGIERVLLHLKKFKKPIYITENGVADAKDKIRESFIKDHLSYVHKAIQKGADIRGYLHWSLLDNFEWEKGFGPRFGLIEVDYEDLCRRRIRHSALKYAEICKNNSMDY